MLGHEQKGRILKIDRSATNQSRAKHEMRVVLPTVPSWSTPRSLVLATKLLVVLKRLEEIERGLIAEGMGDEAGSVTTVIADLRCQAEEFLTTVGAGRRIGPPLRPDIGSNGKGQ